MAVSLLPTPVLRGQSGHTRCLWVVTWSGNRIHRRDGLHLWCDVNRRHAGPPTQQWLREWKRCERCFE